LPVVSYGDKTWPLLRKSINYKCLKLRYLVKYLDVRRTKEVNLGYDIRRNKSQDSSVGIETGYDLDDWMIGVRFPAGLGIFLFDTVSRPALGPT
jgi:hypothetical protein